MNPQPVSLADDVEAVVQRMRIAVGWHKGIAPGVVSGWADELSALLAQHAVAEPQEVTISGSPAIYSVNDPQHRTLAWQPSFSAHAAEQPKLTAEQVRALCEDSGECTWCGWPYHKTPPLHGYDCKGAVLANLPEGPIMDNSYDKLRTRVGYVADALLTSPVAPPPRNDKREGAERTARLLCETRGHTGRRPCDFCQMQIDACLRETEPLRTCYCGTPKEPHCESVHAPPPVAPGEQPPQRIEVCGMCGDFLQGDYCPACDAHVDEDARNLAPAPPAQERASDERQPQDWIERLLRDIYAAENLAERKEIVATAAKQAREGALESISEITKRWHAEAMKLLDKTKNATDRVEQLTLRKCAEQIDDAIRLAAQPSPQTKEDVK